MEAKRLINEEIPINAKYCPDIPCRWDSYGTYRLLIIIYMLNEASIVFVTTFIGHGPYYFRGFIFLVSVVLIGVPVIYSEICNAQLTNTSLISMWNYFPVLRGFGHGMTFLMFLRSIYVSVLASWYLMYAFYAAFEVPPWFTCDNVNSSFCMVKRRNVSVFQHCIDLQLSNQDCEINTASWHFFMDKIGAYNTYDYPASCFFRWCPLVASFCINFSIFLLAIKREKYLQLCVKVVMIYISVTMFVLTCVALSTEGAWYSTKSSITWNHLSIIESFHLVTSAAGAVGAGSGMLAFLSRDVSFRAPANMTALATSLLSVCFVLGFAFVIYTSIKAMYVFHGQIEYILEMGETVFFDEFGSISEVLGYLYDEPVWGFLWFSSIFACLFMNVWLLHMFLNDLIMRNFAVAQTYYNTFRFIVKLVVCIMTLPFYCCDLFETLRDVISIVQLVNTFVFSVSLYWFYGFRRHSVDVTFMIGVKANTYWQVVWALHPLMVLGCLLDQVYLLWYGDRSESWPIFISETESDLKTIILYLLLTMYALIIICCTLFELLTYRFHGFWSLVTPTKNWGPKDSILYKSRKMFVPEIMTTEFLYRQVRIRGYKHRKPARVHQIVEEISTKESKEDSIDKIEWSALTSN